MDAGIQGALSILATISGPSPVLDGLVDQIVSTGLPMVPALVSAAAAAAAVSAVAGSASAATTSADTTARMLLNGMQRAAEHVSVERKVAIVKGIAKHVCPSPVLPWAVRAFAVKALQAIFQNTFSSVPTDLKADAVSAAAEAVIIIIQTAHTVDLAKHLKVTTEATDALLSAPHPYHNAEIKSASEFFATLTELDADAVASVYSPRQKSHLATVAEIVASASENSAATSVAQAVQARFDLIALGLPRTLPLRVALEKLNCGVLLELEKKLSELAPVDAFDHVIKAYPLFFGRTQHHQHKKVSSDKNNSITTTQSEQTDEASVANAESSTAGNAEEKSIGANNEADIFTDSLVKLTSEQNVSKDTVCMFLKERLKESIACAGKDLAAETGVRKTGDALAWSGRLALLSKSNLFARPNVMLAPALADLVYGLFCMISRSVGSLEESEALLDLARSLERYIHRSVTQVSFTNDTVSGKNANTYGDDKAFDPASLTTNATPFHERFIEGLTKLLKALLPAAPLTDESDANMSLNAPLLEVAAMLVSYLSPRPYRYTVTVPHHTEGEEEEGEKREKDDTVASIAVADKATKRPREEEQDEEHGDEHSENEGDDEDLGDNEENGAKAATPSKEKTKEEARFHYYNTAQSFFATVMRGGQLTALQTALRKVNDEINTVEVSKRLAKLLGDKAPVEVRQALVEDNSGDTATAYLSSSSLYYRQRVLQNIIAVFRLQSGGRSVSVGIASYSPAAMKKDKEDEGGENDEVNQHRHRNNNARFGGARNNVRDDKDASKRHRPEDNKHGGPRTHIHNSNVGHHRGGAGINNDRRGFGHDNTNNTGRGGGRKDDRDNRRDFRDRRDNRGRR